MSPGAAGAHQRRLSIDVIQKTKKGPLKAAVGSRRGSGGRLSALPLTALSRGAGWLRALVGSRALPLTRSVAALPTCRDQGAGSPPWLAGWLLLLVGLLMRFTSPVAANRTLKNSRTVLLDLLVRRGRQFIRFCP